MEKINMYLPRKWRQWSIVALVLVSPFFFIGGSEYQDPRSIQEVWNLGHFFYFAMLIFVIDSYWCVARRSMSFRILATFSTLLIIGLGIELIQLNIAGRSFSWTDVMRDISGGATALLWKTGHRLPRTRSILSVLIVMTIVVLNFIPLAGALADEYRSYRDFPLLAGFENKAELSRWEGERVGLTMVSMPRVQGKYSGKITLTTDEYSGLSLQYFPGDWSGWKGLAFNVFNPGQQITLHYRVHDSLHRANNQTYADRFNGKTVLQHGWNEIVIPMVDIANGPRQRKMDITKITGFGIFVMNQAERRVLYLDNVRLL